MSGPTRKRRPWLALLLVAAIAAVFGRSAGFGFVLLDDDRNVYTNPLVHPQGEQRIARAWREPYLKLYVPVTYTIWALVADAALVDPDEAAEPAPQVMNGLSARPFHLVNLALHCLAALLVFAALRGLLGVDIAATLGALLFALHPLQVEPVAWVSGLKDLVSGCLVLASLCLYLRHARADGRAPVAWGLALVCFALGFLAKPSAVVLPLLAGVLDVWVLRRGWKRAAASLWPFLALAAAGVVLVTRVQPPDAELPTVALWQRPLVALDALGFYLGKLVAPFELVPFNGRRPDVVLAGGRWWIGALAVGVLLAGVLAARRRSTVPLAALGLFVAALAPVLGLVPFTFQAFSTVADRYAYLALLGPALLLGWLVRGNKLGIGFALVILGLLGARAADQVGHWKSSQGLFVHNLAVNPESAIVHGNLGEIYAREGNPEGAVEHFSEAVRLRPESAQHRNNLGQFLGQNGRLEEALEHLKETVRIDPDYAAARMGLASTLMGLGRFSDAIDQLSEVNRIEPDFMPAYLSRAVLHLQDNQVQEAITALRAAVSLAPEHAGAQAELGRALMISNRPVDALPHLEEALRLDPGQQQVKSMLDAARAAAGARQP